MTFFRGTKAVRLDSINQGLEAAGTFREECRWCAMVDHLAPTDHEAEDEWADDCDRTGGD